jgi:hypothetical protein
MFSWAKKNVHLEKKHCSVNTEKLHNIFFYKKNDHFLIVFLSQNRLNIYNEFVLLYWRHFPGQLLYNDFALNH